MHGMNKFNLYRYSQRKCLSGVDTRDGREGSETLVWENGRSQRPSFNQLEEKEGRKPTLFSIFITSPEFNKFKVGQDCKGRNILSPRPQEFSQS